MNTVTISGRLTADAKIMQTQSGTKIAMFTVAWNRKTQMQEETCFFDVKAFGYAAEDAETLTKGAGVCIAGELRQEKWMDKQTGKQVSRIVVVANEIYVRQARRQAQAMPTQSAPMPQFGTQYTQQEQAQNEPELPF